MGEGGEVVRTLPLRSYQETIYTHSDACPSGASQLTLVSSPPHGQMFAAYFSLLAGKSSLYEDFYGVDYCSFRSRHRCAALKVAVTGPAEKPESRIVLCEWWHCKQGLSYHCSSE